MKVAIYPGTFDPITKGHLDIIKRSSKFVDKLIIAVSENDKKKTLFSISERMEMIKSVIQDEGLNSSASPRVEVLEILPVKMKLTVPLEPDVKIGDYTKIRVEQNKVKVSTSEVNERIEGLRTSLGSWEPVDDRNVKLKDMVTIDVTGHVESEKIVDQKNVTLVADEGQGVSFKGFATNLVGMSVNSTKEFDIKLEDDLADEKLKGKLIKFSVIIHEIKEQNLPKVDDEFAKSAGDGYDSLTAMKKSIGEEILKGKQDQSDKEFTDKVLDLFDVTDYMEFEAFIKTCYLPITLHVDANRYF